ncbi:MAG: hypothetical protein GY850_38800, partial [bacterium]|nr:hypothetical protein [bacterium]
MEQQTIQQTINQYLNLLRRGKYFILIPVTVALIIGSAVAFKLPPVYESSAKIFYRASQVPDSFGIVGVNIYLEAALMFVEALTFNRTACTQIIQDFNLYPDLIDKVPAETIVAGFLDSYTLEYTYTSVAGKGGKSDEVLTGFNFTFEHVSPQAAFQITNELAGRFIKQYARFRANAAFSTSTFFDDERLRLKQEIAEIDRE